MTHTTLIIGAVTLSFFLLGVAFGIVQNEPVAQQPFDTIMFNRATGQYRINTDRCVSEEMNGGALVFISCQ